MHIQVWVKSEQNYIFRRFLTSNENFLQRKKIRKFYLHSLQKIRRSACCFLGNTQQLYAGHGRFRWFWDNFFYVGGKSTAYVRFPLVLLLFCGGSLGGGYAHIPNTSVYIVHTLSSPNKLTFINANNRCYLQINECGSIYLA